MIKPRPWQILPQIFWPFLFLSLAFGLSAWSLPLAFPERFTLHFLRNATALKAVHMAALGHLGLMFLTVTVQALPVLFHQPKTPRNPSLFGLASFAFGVLMLVSFFAGWRNPWALAAAATGLSLGWLVLMRRAKALAEASSFLSFAWQGLGPAFLYLGAMILLGSLMALGLLRPLLAQDPLATIQLHLHLGLWGFASLAIFGFLPKLLRLFQASTGYAPWPLKLAIGLVHAALALLLLQWLGWGSPWTERAAALLLPASALAFALQIFLLLKSAKARRLDSSLASQLLGLLFLISASLLDAWLLWKGGDWRMQAACLALGLGGWIGAVLHGTTQRICAVLAWFQRFLVPAETMAVPTAWDLIHPGLAWSVPALHGAGTVFLAAGLWQGQEALIQGGGLLGSLALAATASLAALSLRRGKAEPFPGGVHPFEEWVREQKLEAESPAPSAQVRQDI